MGSFSTGICIAEGGTWCEFSESPKANEDHLEVRLVGKGLQSKANAKPKPQKRKEQLPSPNEEARPSLDRGKTKRKLLEPSWISSSFQPSGQEWKNELPLVAARLMSKDEIWV